MNVFTRASVLAACFIAPLAVAKTADQGTDFAAAGLFSHVADIGGAGREGNLCRLGLSPEVLAVASLPEDMRLSAAGLEHPFLVDSQSLRSAPVAGATLVPTNVSVRRAGFWSDERVTFRLPREPLPAGQHWQLRVETNAREFARDYVLRIDGAVVRRGSVFRYERPYRARQTIELDVPINTTDIPSRLEWSLELRGYGGPVEPYFFLSAVGETPPPARVSGPWVVTRIARFEGKTTVVLGRPPGVHPTHLRFETDTTLFARTVRVFDVRQGRDDGPLGTHEIVGAPTGDRRTVPMALPRGESIRVVIEDGDSPPLANLRVTAETAQPSLVFACASEMRLWFGGGRARRPAYDLERLIGSGAFDDESERTPLTLGAVGPNADYDSGPALGAYTRPGQVVDRTGFRFVASAALINAREGSARMVLPAEVLAHVNADLRDLRVVDAAGRAIPHVRAPRNEPARAPLEVRVVGDEGGQTRYALEADVGALPLRAISITTDAPFVRRNYALRVLPDDGQAVEVRGVLEQDADAIGPMEIATPAAFASGAVTGAIELTVDNGSDASLSLRAEGLYDAPALYVLAEDGAYELLVGGDVAAPSYEVRHALPLILAASAGEVRLGDLRENAAYEPPAITEGEDGTQLLVWGALIIAVLVLAFLTWRTSRMDVAKSANGTPSPSPSPSPPSEAEPEASETADGEPAGETAASGEQASEAADGEPASEAADGEPASEAADGEPASESPADDEQDSPP
ncbi:MAG: hypothetical protein AAF938_08555 [Myxococcota bacterium]